MMAHGQTTMARPPPLLDLLGASFEFNTRVNALVWDGGVACIGLADGAIAMVPAEWPGGPTLAHRPGGGVEIKAGEAPPPPPGIVAAHRGAVLSLAPMVSGGIVSGGADGRFLRIAGGTIETICEWPRKAVSHVAAGRGGRCAMVAGHQIDLFGPDARRIAAPGAVTALVYDPSGLNLAIAHADGVVVATGGVKRLRPAGLPGAIAWNADGTMLATAMIDGMIAVQRIDSTAPVNRFTLPEQPVAIGFAADDALIIAAGDMIFRWCRGDDLPSRGIAGAAPVTALASHPRRSVIAWGDAAGGLFLSQPGLPDRMTVRDAGAGVIHLAFAADGEALTFAADDNEAGVIALPDLLFRTEARP